MSSTNSRPTRSRFSSPFVGTPINTSAESPSAMAEITEKPKTFLDKWVEPPLPAPRPSFAEAGIERHGVVQNMVPLGTRPSQKVMKAAARPEVMDGVGRTTQLKKPAASSVSTPSESVMTPEPPTIPARGRSESASKVEEVPSTPHTPQDQTSPQKSVPRSSVPPQHMGQGVFALQQSPIALVTNMARPVPPPAPVVMPSQPALGPDGLPIINFDLTDKVVEAAVQEALDFQRWPTAYALRTLYDDHRTNPRIVRLIEAIYNSRATEENKIEFRSIMKHKKKEGKKDRTGEYYFNGDGSDPAPRTLFSAINAINPPAPTYQSPYDPRPGSGHMASSSITQSSVSVSPQKESDQHVSKKHRGNSFQATDAEVNGNASANGGVTGRSPSQANGTGKKGTPRRHRSKSVSSTSSLSSVDEQILDDGEFAAPEDPSLAPPPPPPSLIAKIGGLERLGLNLGGAPPPRFVSPYASANNFSAAASSAETHARNQRQPITAPPKPGPKTYTFSTVTTAPISTSPAVALSSSAKNNAAANHRPPPTNSKSSMAPAALLSSSNSSSTSTYNKVASTSSKAKKNKALANEIATANLEGRTLDENDTNSRLKRKARAKTNQLTSKIGESFERYQVKIPDPQDVESASDGGDSIAVAASKKRPPKVRLLNNRETRQRLNYDSEDLSSPTLLSFQPDIAPGSLSVSRAGTPNNFNRPTRKAKTGTGLRVKSSPMKKKGSTLAGIPRQSGERSPVGNGAFSQNNQDENDDYCSACGGNGDLVCCDGCTRSFHFKCVDPPIIEGSLPDEWFCNVCQSRRKPLRDEADIPGAFGPLLANIDGKNPSAFRLPDAIRGYFVDVKTGPDGEYEEGTHTKAKNRSGYDEAPDFFRLRDGKGKPIFCHECHGSASAPSRMIIPCSFCGLYWHLDCLPIPLAKEPGPGRQWRCPAHVDDLLAILPATLAPAHRFRKIKGASAIKPAFARGVRNNGHIEIENDPSEDEEEQGFYEQREYGHVYRLPEVGIKLDFISKVKQQGGGYLPSRVGVVSRAKPSPNTKGWNQRTVDEQQAALNLASIAARSKEPNLQPLINTLLAEAPPAVVSLIAQGQADNISENTITSMDKRALLMLQEVIEKTLARIPSPMREPEPEPETEPASPPAKTPPPFTAVPRTPTPASPLVFSASPTSQSSQSDSNSVTIPTVDEPQTEGPQIDGPQTAGPETETEQPDDGDTIVDEDVEMLL